MRRLGWLCVVVLLIGSIGCVSEAERLKRQEARIEAKRLEAEAARKANLARESLQREQAVAAMQVIVADDFGGPLRWQLDARESDAAKVALTTPDAKTKERALEVSFTLGEKKKVVVNRRATTAMDLSNHTAMIVDVKSDLKADCVLSLALHTQPGWKYFESPKVTLSPGVNQNVIFRLQEANFKTAESKWQYTQKVANLKAVTVVTFIVHPTTSGRVEFDNLRLGKPAAVKAEKATKK
mgnify:CR=1 FL=1